MNILLEPIPTNFYIAYHQALLQDIPVHFTIYWPKMAIWFDVTTCHFDDSLSVSFKGNKNPEDPEPSLRQQKSLNDMYRLITEVTTDCLWEWDLLSQQILWIDGGPRVLTSIFEFFTKCIADDWEQEYRFQKLNGEYAYVHDRGHIVYNRDKRTSRMIGATQDITARKSVELQLLRSERNLAQQQLKNQKEIIQAVMIAQEKERAHIGKELHDNLNQILRILVEDVMRIDPIQIQFREEGIIPAELNETQG